MTRVSAAVAYRIWAPCYDDTPNALLALELRTLQDVIGPVAGRKVLDVATGTGRWMRYLVSRGAFVFGIDLSPPMLEVAARNDDLAGRLAVADIQALPIANDAADIAICSFALGYVPFADRVIREMARVARRVIVSDLHADAIAAGWSRSFRVLDRVYEIENHVHSRASVDAAARSAGLVREWEVTARFGERERELFVAAGKGAEFDRAAQIPAVVAVSWRRA